MHTAEPIRVNSREFVLPKWCIAVLVFSVTISPRIPLPFFIPGRTFDLRIEDVLISILLAASAFLAFTGRKKFYFTALGVPIGIYLAIIVFVTVLAAGAHPANVPRTFLYTLKEVEYFAFVLLIANWLQQNEDLELMGKVLLLGGTLNIGWAVVQVMSAHYGALIALPIPDGAYTLPESRRIFWHGICSIGEHSPFSVAGFFALISFLSYSFFFFGDKTSGRGRFYLVLGLAFSTCSVLTGEKISFVFFIIGLLTMVTITARSVKRIAGSLLLIAVFAVILIGIPKFLTDRAPRVSAHLFQLKTYKIDDERLHRWRQLIPLGLEHSLTGIGKGSQPYIRDDDEYLEESHNHYIKVFVESGIFGLAAFTFLLGAIGRFCINLLRRGKYRISRIMAAATLSSLFGLGAAAVVQDAFKPVLPNEIFWILVGLTMAAVRMEEYSNANVYTPRKR